MGTQLASALPDRQGESHRTHLLMSHGLSLQNAGRSLCPKAEAASLSSCSTLRLMEAVHMLVCILSLVNHSSWFALLLATDLLLKEASFWMMPGLWSLPGLSFLS